MEDKKVSRTQNKPVIQNVIMENREKLCVSGVIDVDSFNEESIILITELGVILVKGEQLKINKLSIDSGEVILEGLINSVIYQDGYGKEKGNFFSRMFK